MKLQCPKCKSKDVRMQVNKNTCIAIIECGKCNLKSEPIKVIPANDIAKKQVGFNV